MLQEAIEKNRGFLKVCGIAAVVFAGIYVVYGLWNGILAATTLRWLFRSHHSSLTLYYAGNVPTSLLLALMFLALGEFLWWLLCCDHKPSLLLQHVDKVIYVYAATRVLFLVLQGIAAAFGYSSPTHWFFWRELLRGAAMTAMNAVLLVPWVLLAIAARKGVKLIEEFQRSRKVMSGQGESEQATGV